MEYIIKAVVRGLVFPILRTFFWLFGSQMSSIQSLGPGCLQASTREQLLHQCQETPARKVPLLRRQFKQLPVATHLGNDAPDSGNCQSNGLAAETGPDVSMPGDGRVRVMVWNVLADALSMGADNFIKCPMEALLWEHRKYAIIEEILTYDPDVVCLQEVDHYEDFFQPVLQQIGYSGSFNPKPDSPCLDCVINNGPDGCAVLFKTGRFKLVKSELPNLEVDYNGKKFVSNQVAVMHHLKCISEELPAKEFCIATTHLKAKRGYETMRAKQGQHLIEVLKNCSRNLPLIVGGDFNAEPTEDVYNVYKTSDLNLASAYQKLSKDGLQEPPYTTWKIRPRREECHTIDYMWYSQKHLEPVALLQFPGEEDIGSGRLPSWSYPSDHLSLVCDFVFKRT
ncbi:nocturnin-like isoform X1 [Lytechinus variegatus]|uniref:nocturnin-like isoform X1 n=1 Tax=Lytechinus variegatus TaxID=7654 RepID=UPI001BB1850A|nr:nocturnin-like isoform X1 [Lytechinus variegatus]